jgi:hypothetical protein
MRADLAATRFATSQNRVLSGLDDPGQLMKDLWQICDARCSGHANVEAARPLTNRASATPDS